MTEETKKKISESTKGRPAHNKGKKELIKHVYYTDGNVSIRIPIDQEPPEGFVRGRLKRKMSDEEKLIFNEKRIETCNERYGDPHYNNMEKNKQTKLDHYGDENYNNREQAKQTCLDKYGYDNPSKSDDVKIKIAQTNFDRRGISYSFQDKDILLKAIQNSTSEECARQRMETCLRKYGVPYAGSLFGIPSSRDSKNNLVFKQILIESDLFVDDSTSREITVDNFRYDFKVNNILIEINPTATHNSTYSIYSGGKPKPKEYHYEKAKVARSNNYRFIAVWDWDDIIKLIKLIQPKEKIYARKCDIRVVSQEESKIFLNIYHLQGYVKSEINIGLYYHDELISIMTFGKPRYNKNYEYELIRYCSSKNIVGGAEKLFKYFITTCNPKSIISYCDWSKFNGDVYLKLGFQYKSYSIGKHWYNESTKKHITDNLLRQRGFDQLFGKEYGTYGKGTSNEQLMLKHGFVEIYDCGQAVYEWREKI